jgi:DNA-binding XRE family transcriptional regulator
MPAYAGMTNYDTVSSGERARVRGLALQDFSCLLFADDITFAKKILCGSKGRFMVTKANNYPSLVKEIRKQLGLSQEDLARELGVSFASVNRWENGQVRPSKLAKAQLNAFCTKMAGEGRLKLSGALA